ncbi:MAG: hypothetical protein IPI67_05955 [Myxococcales bacterium]|nr:hypothetical protein [Myxococcales bacterium]
MKGARRFRTLVLVVGLWGGACRQIAGIDDRVSEVDASDNSDAAADSSLLSALACGALPGFAGSDSPGCRACLATDCCGEISACNADADCVAAVTCMAGCGKSADVNCYQTCSAEHPDSRARSAAALACRVRACDDACGDAARCGRPPGPSNACTTCVDQACCKEERDAYGVAAAREVMLCLAACGPGDLGCQNACYIGHPGAGAYQVELQSCASLACASVCGAPHGAQCGIEVADGDVCTDCFVKNCCAATKACDGDPACSALQYCADGCGASQACQDACITSSSSHARALFFAAINCGAHHCNSECQFPPARRCGIGLPDPSCLECGNQKCCEQATAAALDVRAIEYQLCSEGCSSEQCKGDCAIGNPVGKKLFQAFFDCLLAQCSDICFPSNLDAGGD